MQFLGNYYRRKYDLTQFFSRVEVRTVKEYKEKRADRLLGFESPFQKEHTVSLEAKSHKTLGALILFWNDRDFIPSTIAGIVLAIISVFFLIIWIGKSTTLISVVGFMVGFLLCLFVLLFFEPDLVALPSLPQ